jgi:hypothetical protein
MALSSTSGNFFTIVDTRTDQIVEETLNALYDYNERPGA